MAYPYVQAANDYGRRSGPTLAFCIHMAEGGGTVGFLSRPNKRGVSVHYVIEYSGRIVQMLRENHASGSINPNDLRTTDGPPPYGASVAKAVLGSWYWNPNEAILSVEIEGFAKDGPNAAERVALGRLVTDLRTRYPDIGLLGHRDFQDYKACPGAHIPWDALGGHGPAEGVEMNTAVFTRTPRTGTFTIKAGDDVSGYNPQTLEVVKTWEPHDADSTGHFTAVLSRQGNISPSPLLEAEGRYFDGLWVPQSQVAETFDPAPDPTPVVKVLGAGYYQVVKV